MAEPVVQLLDLAAQRRCLEPWLGEALARVVDHGAFVNGPEVLALEAALTDRSGVPAVTCASGTDALVLSLRALGVGPGDVVAVPAFTFVAPAEAVALCGATPLFVDVQADPPTVDPDALAMAFDESAASGRPPVGAIAVDLFGHPAEHDRLRAVADRYDAWLVVDAAQSFGALAQGRPTVAGGRVATTSFFPAKPLGAYGDGGAVFTDDAKVAGTVRSLREHGSGANRYDHERVGTTSRLDTLQAAVLIEKLRVFDDECAERRRLADRYGRLLGDVVAVPRARSGSVPVWAQYTVRTPARDWVRSRLAERGVPTAVHYPRAVHEQPAFAGSPVAGGAAPVAEALAREVLSLPLHPYLGDQGQDLVVEAVRVVLAEVGS